MKSLVATVGVVGLIAFVFGMAGNADASAGPTAHAPVEVDGQWPDIIDEGTAFAIGRAWLGEELKGEQSPGPPKPGGSVSGCRAGGSGTIDWALPLPLGLLGLVALRASRHRLPRR